MRTQLVSIITVGRLHLFEVLKLYICRRFNFVVMLLREVRFVLCLDCVCVLVQRWLCVLIGLKSLLSPETRPTLVFTSTLKIYGLFIGAEIFRVQFPAASLSSIMSVSSFH